MWSRLTALAVMALAVCAPALAQTGGTAPPPATSAAPTGGVIAEEVPSGGGVPVPAPAPEPAPQPEPAPPPEPEPPEPPTVPALTALTDLRERPRPVQAIALGAQQEDPLQDLPQLAPPAETPSEEEQQPAPEEPQQQTVEPRLADTGLEALLLAYVGFVLVAVGLSTLAVLRKAHRLRGSSGG